MGSSAAWGIWEIFQVGNLYWTNLYKLYHVRTYSKYKHIIWP